MRPSSEGEEVEQCDEITIDLFLVVVVVVVIVAVAVVVYFWSGHRIIEDKFRL